MRINGLDTGWWREDLAGLDGLGVDAVLVPKVDRAESLDRVAALTRLPLWAMMETPLGILNAASIAAHPRLAGMVMGTNDLAKDLGARFRADRLPMMAGLGLCLLAARAHGLTIVDGVYNAFRDETGLRAECEQGRDMGFDGKTLIHPSQVGPCNTIFSPDPETVAFARKTIEAFELPENKGKGVLKVDGKMVEILHAEIAKRTVAIADAIAELEA